MPRITFTPDSTTPTTFIISRGENGYSNQERAEILLVRPPLRGQSGSFFEKRVLER
jgi:hypothetical protein